MKQKVAFLTAMGLFINLLLPQPVSAEYVAGDLQRLHWLCSDYQLPVKGYVIEGWLALPQRPGLQAALQEQLNLKEGQHQGTLLDGSTLNTSVLRHDQKLYVELQLITDHLDTAQHYYALWQSFADGYKTAQPIGVTVITELPELLDNSAKEKLTAELQQSLCAAQTEQCHLGAVQQITGYSPQLQHSMVIGGQKINYNIAFTERESKTVLYIATPVIYQQY